MGVPHEACKRPHASGGHVACRAPPLPSRFGSLNGMPIRNQSSGRDAIRSERNQPRQ